MTKLRDKFLWGNVEAEIAIKKHVLLNNFIVAFIYVINQLDAQNTSAIYNNYN